MTTRVTVVNAERNARVKVIVAAGLMDFNTAYGYLLIGQHLRVIADDALSLVALKEEIEIAHHRTLSRIGSYYIDGSHQRIGAGPDVVLVGAIIGLIGARESAHFHNFVVEMGKRTEGRRVG